MAKNPGSNPFAVFLGLDGRPLNGGDVFIGIANMDPETNPQQVYWDAEGLIPAAQPLETLSGYVVNGNNVARFWTDTTSYSIRVRDRLGNEVFYAAEVKFEYPDGSVTADAISDDTDDLEAINDKLQPYQKYWLTRYGAVGDGVTVDDTAFAAWRSAIAAETDDLSDNLKFAPVGYVPKGNYVLNSDQELPYNVDSYARFTGAGVLYATDYTDARINGIYAAGLVARGQFNSVFDGVYSPLTVKGGGTNQGTFWSQFRNINNNATIDLSDWSVNFNMFLGGKGNFSITGTSGNLRDGHANMVMMYDVTSGSGTGLSNTSTMAQTNWAFGVYYENGKTISGPWHVAFFHGDDGGPPQISREHHAMFSTNVIEKNSSDFLATATGNIAVGGEWDYLNSSGYPNCLAMMTPASSSVATDTTEPFGMGKSLQASFTAALSGFTITLSRTTSERFSLVLAYYSPTGADFSSIEVNRGGGDTTFGGASSVGTAGGWRLLRISGKASASGTTTIRLYAQGGSPSGSVTFKIGAIRATEEKAVMLPSKQPAKRFNGGISIHESAVIVAGVEQSYVSGGTSVDVVVPFGVTFSGAPTNVVPGIVLTHATQSLNFSKYIVTAVTTTQCTVRVYYTTEWTGRVCVTATGTLA